MAKNAADLTAGARKNGNHKNGTAKPGLRFGRYFTPEGSHAYDLIEWERRTAAIIGEKGQVIFEQKDVEVPRAWSQLAINVVAQKYFRGSPGSPERETRVRQRHGHQPVGAPIVQGAAVGRWHRIGPSLLHEGL